MRRIIGLVALVGVALAASADEVLSAAQAYLKAGPWRALVEGELRTPSGEVTSTKMRVLALPSEGVVRVEFLAPGSVADNFVVITPEKVYNYLFLTNQLVVYPRERARIEGLGIQLGRIGELDRLGGEAGLRWRLAGEEATDAGPAYRLVGEPEDPEEAGFARVELWVLKDPPRPLRYRVVGVGGEVLADLVWKEFERAQLSRAALLDYPPDAEVIEK